MSIEGIVQEVRAEIGRLQVLALLGKTVRVQRARTGKPRRKMSAGRKRIAAAQRTLGEDSGNREVGGRSSNRAGGSMTPEAITQYNAWIDEAQENVRKVEQLL